MMNYNTHLSAEDNEAWQQRYATTKMGKQVSFLPRVKSTLEVAKVMGDVDCGVFPARAEGWNLELLEMMSMGKQVIATDYSAHTQYCNADNCKLISIDELEDAKDGVWFSGEGQWAKFGDNQMEQLIHHMRQVHASKALNVAGIETAKRFSWKAAAERVVQCIQMDGTDY
jgi:glycosyltransferase involved in cell wall biosynthesis